MSKFETMSMLSSACPSLVLRSQGAKLQYGKVPLYTRGDDPNAKQFSSLHAVQVSLRDGSEACLSCSFPDTALAPLFAMTAGPSLELKLHVCLVASKLS